MRSRAAPYVFVAPAVLLFAAFTAYPIVRSLLLSFQERSGTSYEFVGLENYKRLLEDPQFFRSLLNTAEIAIMAGPTHLVLALGLAVALNAGFVRLRGVFRTVLFLPAITSLVVIAVVFSILFNTSFGFINYVAGQVGIPPVPWLDDPVWAKVSVAVVLVWRWTGYMMVIYLAALQTIPTELYDAAAVDGAGRWNQFRYVTLPQLRPTILFTVILSMIGSSQLFDEPFVLTRGGPGDSTQTVAMYLYKNGFEFFDAAYASSIAYSIVLIVAVLTFLSMRVGRRGVA